MLRGDLAAARIPYRDEQGRVFDFHALRHHFITSLATAGVHPKVAQTLARHSDINLTMDRYTHLAVADVAGGLDGLPELPSEPATTGTAKATGTDGGADSGCTNGWSFDGRDWPRVAPTGGDKKSATSALARLS